jgi:cytochrome c heme-lyase
MEDSCPFSAEKDSSCPAIDATTNLPVERELQQKSTENSEKLDSKRTASSIPRSASSQTWTYPSPRMFYNALLRKGFDTQPEDVEVMVNVHNFLNEQVWAEILKWESQHTTICPEPKLKRFMGRPHDLSPRARFFSFFFGTPKPFDRHDWTIDRCGREVRYVIDYYSGPKGEEGVFYCDVRPALDSFSAAVDRSRNCFNEFTDKLKNIFKIN